jgi:hypothetical protein
LRACEKKFPKLASWQSRGAKSILVLEDNDVQNTGDHLVAEAGLAAEQSVNCSKPDEIYLVTTFSMCVVWTCDSDWRKNILRF